MSTLCPEKKIDELETTGQIVVYAGYLPPIEIYLTKEFIGISRGYSWPEENIHLKFDTPPFIGILSLFKHNHRTYAMHKTAYTCV